MPYLLVCTLIGVVVGWIPMLLHGPIPEKLNLLYIQGSVAVWGFYVARLMIGFMVGVTSWPRTWWLRGPLFGFLTLLPLTIFILAVPGCGSSCMIWNLTSATAIGAVVAGTAFLVTGRHHA